MPECTQRLTARMDIHRMGGPVETSMAVFGDIWSCESQHLPLAVPMWTALLWEGLTAVCRLTAQTRAVCIPVVLRRAAPATLW